MMAILTRILNMRTKVSTEMDEVIMEVMAKIIIIMILKMKLQ